MRRLRRLTALFTRYMGIRPVRVYALRDCHDPTGEVQGMYWRPKRAIFIRTRSSYRRRRKKAFTWRYMRGILTHELAHLVGSMRHLTKHKKTMRRVGRILTKLEGRY